MRPEKLTMGSHTMSAVFHLQQPASACATLPARAPVHLSPRQVDVLRLLGEGLSNKQIARLLGIADGTVKQHLQCVLGELGAVNRLQAVIYAYRRGLLPHGAEGAASGGALSAPGDGFSPALRPAAEKH
jgi:DNA-binding NarL/FixJ family response regulator